MKMAKRFGIRTGNRPSQRPLIIAIPMQPPVPRHGGQHTCQKKKVPYIRRPSGNFWVQGASIWNFVLTDIAAKIAKKSCEVSMPNQIHSSAWFCGGVHGLHERCDVGVRKYVMSLSCCVTQPSRSEGIAMINITCRKVGNVSVPLWN